MFMHSFSCSSKISCNCGNFSGGGGLPPNCHNYDIFMTIFDVQKNRTKKIVLFRYKAILVQFNHFFCYSQALARKLRNHISGVFSINFKIRNREKLTNLEHFNIWSMMVANAPRNRKWLKTTEKYRKW